MKTELRVQLPPLAVLSDAMPLAWSCRQRGQWQQGHDTLRAMAARWPGASVHAALDPVDVILLELALPPLRGRQLQAAVHNEVELLVLEDAREVVIGHGAVDPLGQVPVAWLAQADGASIAAAFHAAGLRLHAVYPTSLLLPLQAGHATLACAGDHLLLRTARGHGHVLWQGDRRGAVLEALPARLARQGIEAVHWIGAVPATWPAAVPAEALDSATRLQGELPAWSLPLPDAASAPRRGVVPILLAAAVMVAVLATWWDGQRWQQQANHTQAQMQAQVKQRFPAIGEVVAPVAQAQRALQAEAQVQPPRVPEVQQWSQRLQAALPELQGQVLRMDYRPGQLQLQLDPALLAQLEDPERFASWQQAAAAQGLQVALAQGRLRVSGHPGSAGP